MSEVHRVKLQYHNRLANKSEELTLLRLLHTRRGFSITDPRDMIFTHLGFAPDMASDLIAVGYNKSCSQAYTDFAVHCITSFKNLDILFLADDRILPERRKDMPTWVPDWMTLNPKERNICEIIEEVEGVPFEGTQVHSATCVWMKEPQLLACTWYEGAIFT